MSKRPVDIAMQDLLDAKKLFESAEPCTCTKRQAYVAGQCVTINPTTSEYNCKCCNPSSEKSNES